MEVNESSYSPTVLVTLERLGHSTGVVDFSRVQGIGKGQAREH